MKVALWRCCVLELSDKCFASIAFYEMGEAYELSSKPQEAETYFRKAMSVIDGCSSYDRRRLTYQYQLGKLYNSTYTQTPLIQAAWDKALLVTRQRLHVASESQTVAL